MLQIRKFSLITEIWNCIFVLCVISLFKNQQWFNKVYIREIFSNVREHDLLFYSTKILEISERIYTHDILTYNKYNTAIRVLNKFNISFSLPFKRCCNFNTDVSIWHVSMARIIWNCDFIEIYAAISCWKFCSFHLLL